MGDFDDIPWVHVIGRGGWELEPEPDPIPEGSMRVGPNTDAIVWRICPTHEGRPA